MTAAKKAAKTQAARRALARRWSQQTLDILCMNARGQLDKARQRYGDGTVAATIANYMRGTYDSHLPHTGLDV